LPISIEEMLEIKVDGFEAAIVSKQAKGMPLAIDASDDILVVALGKMLAPKLKAIIGLNLTPLEARDCAMEKA